MEFLTRKITSGSTLTRKISGSSKQTRKRHETLPWISDPFNGVDLENISFHPRHEASPLELFFDLFFVANLATFTAYHAIVDGETIRSYIGFFTILWSTWFQITLYDARFSRDSVFERICKAIQFLMFVLFAFIGAKFDPSKNGAKDSFFRTVCVTLAVTRILTGVQYAMVVFFAIKNKANKVIVPLCIISFIFVVTAIVDASLVKVFDTTSDEYSHRLDDVFYGMIVLEAVTVIGVSMFWRSLSFKKTHLMERMGLLTLIVIGEGAIGVTKTVSKLMGKDGLDVVDSAMVFCIVMILFFLFALYFDNQPEHHYGTIRQQIFCVLHFPLHLCIVAVVEGAQQISQARWTFDNLTKFYLSMAQACSGENLEGEGLKDALITALEKLHLEYEKDYKTIVKIIDYAVKDSSTCSADNTAALTADTIYLPQSLFELLSEVWGTVFTSLGIKLAKGSVAAASAFRAYDSVYVYIFSAFIIIMAILVVFIGLTRRHKHDIFDLTSILIRCAVSLVAFVLLIHGISKERVFQYEYMSTPWILPTIVLLLFGVIAFDRAGRELANFRLKKKGLYSEESDSEKFSAEGSINKHEEHVNETAVPNAY